MAEYRVNLGSGTDPLNVKDFNTKANTQYPNPEENSTGIFVYDETGESAMPPGRFFTYNNKIWFLNVLPVESFEKLNSGYAYDFRETLNSNFEKISDQADTIDKNMEVLRDNLKPVATTGSTSDIVEAPDGSKMFVSQEEKEYWNERGIFSENDPQVGANRVKYDTGDTESEQRIIDITDKIAAYIESQIPSTTQDLGQYNNRFILVDKDNYARPVTGYWHLTAEDASGTNPKIRITSEGASAYGWNYMIIFEDSRINPVVGGVIKEQVPIVLFDETTCSKGYSSSCISGRDSVSAENGWIKFGSSLAAIPDDFDATIVTLDYSSNLN